MIKHRFILRDVSDFKIFAAIPVESSLLTWKKWTRPPDWEALKAHGAVIRERLNDVAVCLDLVARGYAGADSALQADKFNEMTVRRPGETDEDVAAVRNAFLYFKAEHTVEAAAATELAASYRDCVHIVERMLVDLTEMPFDECVLALAGVVAMQERQATSTQDKLTARVKRFMEEVRESVRDGKLSPSAQAGADQMLQTYKAILGAVRLTSERQQALLVATEAPLNDLLHSSDPLPTTPCPPGLPFAAYTVEFGDVIVNVVEGHAWVHARRIPNAVIEGVKHDLSAAVSGLSTEERRKLATALKANVETAEFTVTDEEKRVVEIVSQMLCERSLNPKADTKIPVREVDPAKAHQTREAEKREAIKGHAPSVRTIKFEVTPPRYLREAAEHILSNPRRAHWVIGHWRNQFHGEKRALRRQTWIKPHIRGLGEASGTTSRVVAPHAGPTT